MAEKSIICLICFLFFGGEVGESALDRLWVPVGPCFGWFWIPNAVGGRAGYSLKSLRRPVVLVLGLSLPHARPLVTQKEGQENQGT